MSWKLSRRTVLQGAAAAGAAAALTGRNGGLLGGDANAQTAEKSAVVLLFLNGGYNAVFGSADSFSSAGKFGAAGGNVVALGNGLVVDAPTLGTLPTVARANLATIGINHGLSSHDPARIADWSNGSRSYALMLANAMGGSAAIKCAVMGGTFPLGPRPAEGSVSMQQITDLSATINALGGAAQVTDEPSRGPGSAAMIAAKNQSAAPLASNATSLKSVGEAYDSSIALLQGASQSFDFGAMATAYGVATTARAVNSFTMQMVGAELMIRAGANVVIIVNGGWDTHGDTSGSLVRSKMLGLLNGGLRTFTNRMMTDATRNVTTAIFGDFARSLPGSDHARFVSATVMGKKVRVGTTGRVTLSGTNNNSMNLAAGTASVPGFWSYLASVAKSPANPFGTNPHGGLVLP